MNKILNFGAVADDEDVVVTLDGTTYMVKYCRAHNQPGLKLFHSRGDANAPIHDIPELYSTSLVRPPHIANTTVLKAVA
jgi:hypothetical protein